MKNRSKKSAFLDTKKTIDILPSVNFCTIEGIYTIKGPDYL